MTTEFVPVVNLNGESREALVNARTAARIVVMEAMKALAECAPHGRDYQTSTRERYEGARALYVKRFAFLDQLANELEDEAIAIQDQ